MKCPICEQSAQVNYAVNNPFTKKVECPHCGTYYIEPGVALSLENLKLRYNHDERAKKIENEMKRVIKANKIVIFVNDFEKPTMELDEAIYLEMKDICDMVQVFYEDNSRGSDYGD